MAERPGKDEIDKWHRFFAVEFNNRAWELSERETRTPEEDIELMRSAYASAVHWSRIGTEVNAARADVLLARAHALLDHADLARQYAARNLAFLETHDGEPWEHAFAHAVMAQAAQISNDSTAHVEHYAKAQAIGEGMPDPEDRKIFEQTFRLIPAPDGV